MYLRNEGSYIGPYSNDMAPYMVEPQNELRSRQFNGLAFVGPAQSAKTQALILNWLAYSVVVDGLDMIVYSPTQSSARDFSIRRVKRMNDNSPEVGKRLMKSREADNVHDKHYNNGLILNLSWPTKSEFAGRPVGRIALTDYDRMDDDVEGEGAPFDLASKRTTTFRSYAMTVAESSPSRPIENTKWIRTSPHEAPPCKGILSIYNRGDRRRWYWPCPSCGSYFEGKWEHLKYKNKKSVLATAETVYMECPYCIAPIQPSQRQNMQEWGTWLKDGESIDERGMIVGTPLRSTIASFWMNGVAAAFITWQQLVVNYLNAYADYEKTGSEESLSKFFNTDIGAPYISKRQESDLNPERIRENAHEVTTLEMPFERHINRVPMVQPTVPEAVRFLVASVDVQANAFVVQVHGICPGIPYDVVVVDRFQLRKSLRVDQQGEAEWVKPNTYAEDWDLLESEVMSRVYPLDDSSERSMGIKLTVCDSGGREGVTGQAYNFRRRLRAKSLAGRFHLLKGDPLPSRPRAQITLPDSSRKDKFSGARGDVPLLLLNSNMLKDDLRGRLDASEPGKGQIRTPKWLPEAWYSELCVEVRNEKGWSNPRRYRNESWDLLYYCLGACVSSLLHVEGINWNSPPGWAREWDQNDLVTKPNEKEVFADTLKQDYDFKNLGRTLAG